MVDQAKPFGWDRAAIEMAADVARAKLVNVNGRNVGDVRP